MPRAIAVCLAFLDKDKEVAFGERNPKTFYGNIRDSNTFGTEEGSFAAL
jgi:hypothetical protein